MKKMIDFDKKASTCGVKEYDSAKEIILGAWYSPDTIDELWDWYKQAGFNEITIFPSNEETYSYFMKALAYCKNLGINAHVYMHNSSTSFGKGWKELLKGYEHVVSGFDVFDEPLGDKRFSSYVGRCDIDDLIDGVEYVLKEFPDKNLTVTLWPNYAIPDQVSMPDGQGYEDYVKKYCDVILPKIPQEKRWLGVDFYPYYTNRFDGGILKNLELIQYHANQWGADVYLYVQVMDSKVLNWRRPNEHEIRLQYFTALAYGVKNIQVFCYQEPKLLGHNEFGYEDGEALITDGYTPRYDDAGLLVKGEYKRTNNYFVVQKLNQELKTLSKAYTAFTWQGVQTVLGSKRSDRDDFSSLRYTLKSVKGIQSIEAEENLIVGFFKDVDGNDGYMFTNYSNPVDFKSSLVDIAFEDKTRAIVFKNGEQYVVDLIDGHYRTVIDGGDGHFVIPIQ